MLAQSWPMVKTSGRVGGSRLITTRGVGRATRQDNFVQTCKLRHALDDVKVVEVAGKWFHVARGGEYIARFDTVGEAVSALKRG